MDIRTFATTLGRQNIADALGVWVSAVNNAVARGRFPPGWYDAVEKLAEAQGMNCPRDLFGFVGLEGNNPNPSQQPRSPGS